MPPDADRVPSSPSSLRIVYFGQVRAGHAGRAAARSSPSSRRKSAKSAASRAYLLEHRPVEPPPLGADDERHAPVEQPAKPPNLVEEKGIVGREDQAECDRRRRLPRAQPPRCPRPEGWSRDTPPATLPPRPRRRQHPELVVLMRRRRRDHARGRRRGSEGSAEEAAKEPMTPEARCSCAGRDGPGRSRPRSPRSAAPAADRPTRCAAARATPARAPGAAPLRRDRRSRAGKHQAGTRGPRRQWGRRLRRPPVRAARPTRAARARLPRRAGNAADAMSGVGGEAQEPYSLDIGVRLGDGRLGTGWVDGVVAALPGADGVLATPAAAGCHRDRIANRLGKGLPHRPERTGYVHVSYRI